MPYINKMWSLVPNLPDFADLETRCLALSDKVNPQRYMINNDVSGAFKEIRAVADFVSTALKKAINDFVFVGYRDFFKVHGVYISTAPSPISGGTGATAILVLNCGVIHFAESGEVDVTVTVENLTAPKKDFLNNIGAICSAAKKHVYGSSYVESDWDITAHISGGYVCVYSCTFKRVPAEELRTRNTEDCVSSTNYKQCNTQKEVEMLLGNQTKEGIIKAVKSLEDASRIRVANDKVLMPLINAIENAHSAGLAPSEIGVIVRDSGFEVCCETVDKILEKDCDFDRLWVLRCALERDYS